ncbi:hypothetical protein FQA39_LY10296 [Lamprigera yunnana]|nr:hypothetical protein FQA39_LY10296 [Lamprigera yunnana]
MRVVVEKASKPFPKGGKTKQINSKKKKGLSKTTEQSISETISFVVNGHLTSGKSSAVLKKTNTGGKKLKIVPKGRATETILNNKKTIAPNTNRFKRKVKTAIKKSPDVKLKNSKTVKDTSTPRKQTKKNVSDSARAPVLPDADISKSTSSASDKVKLEVKRGVKMKGTKGKIEPRNIKKPIKNDIFLRQKSPTKIGVSEKDKVKDKKSEVLAKKVKKGSTTKQSKTVIAKPKDKVSKAKQTKVKPKKSPVSSSEHKQVKDDVKSVTSKIPKTIVGKEEVPVKPEPEDKKVKQEVKKPLKRKAKAEDTNNRSYDYSSPSDEITLDELRQKSGRQSAKVEQNIQTKKNCKKFSKVAQKTTKKKVLTKKLSPSKINLIKKTTLNSKKNSTKKKFDQRSRKLKLYGFWNGPKRHRVASLNALAKVHCLYENETRGALIDEDSMKSEFTDRNAGIKNEDEEEEEVVVSTRTLRSAPGLRGAGRHWEMHDENFSSSEDNDSPVETVEPEIKKPEPEKKPERKRPYVKRKRNRCELIMDLKDMVVRKRMASLNASAILAASYSVEKRSSKSPKSEDTETEDSEDSYTQPADNKKKCFEEDVKSDEDRKVIEVQATPNKKVSVILNQDTDVTITGVYVNSTTRSTHHEGYCSIAGMQYRISAKSHTQTASTTVATETILQSPANMGQENSATENPSHSCKSYTPLTALSSMQPPGTPVPHAVPMPPQHVGSHVIPLTSSQHVPHTSPIGRRHGCTSAFSAPPTGPYGPPPPAHHPSSSAPPSDPNFIHGELIDLVIFEHKATTIYVPTIIVSRHLLRIKRIASKRTLI